MFQRMPYIFDLCTPFKIICAIVRCVIIYMVYYFASNSFGDKRFSDETMHIVVFPSFADRLQANYFVSMSIVSRS